MKHSASNNWGNVRVDPMKGIRVGEPTAHRQAVRVLISGTESETLACVTRHRDNRAWLLIAESMETRQAVLTLIRSYLGNTEGRGE